MTNGGIPTMRILSLHQSYSPYDNVKKQPTPIFWSHRFTRFAGAVLGACKMSGAFAFTKEDNTVLFLDTNMTAGHGGASGRFDALKETAKNSPFFSLWRITPTVFWLNLQRFVQTKPNMSSGIQAVPNLLALVGNTPLVRLNKIVRVSKANTSPNGKPTILVIPTKTALLFISLKKLNVKVWSRENDHYRDHIREYRF